jgi:hypothetical protein
MAHLVKCSPDDGWTVVTSTCRPPANNYFKCWVHHQSGKVVLASGGDPGWTNGSFRYWMPTSLRHTAFCDWEWRDQDRPEPLNCIVPITTTIETKVIP